MESVDATERFCRESLLDGACILLYLATFPKSSDHLAYLERTVFSGVWFGHEREMFSLFFSCCFC